MLAYKKYVTIKDPAKLELTGLPFRTGQRVEIVMIAYDEERNERLETLRALLRKPRLCRRQRRFPRILLPKKSRSIEPDDESGH